MCMRCAWLIFVICFVPALALSSSCSGLGDNIVTMGAGGGTLQCSKYNTPGGGTTKYQLPDGTFCSFQNTSPDQVSCSGKQGTKSFSQSEFQAEARASVARAYPGEDISAQLKTLELFLPGTVTGSAGLSGAFGEAEPGTPTALERAEDLSARLGAFADTYAADPDGEGSGGEVAAFFIPYDDIEAVYALRPAPRESEEPPVPEEERGSRELSTFGREWRINDIGDVPRESVGGEGLLTRHPWASFLLMLAATAVGYALFRSTSSRT